MNLTMTNQFRIEEDSLGEVQVPADRLWGPRHSARWRISASARI